MVAKVLVLVVGEVVVTVRVVVVGEVVVTVDCVREVVVT